MSVPVLHTPADMGDSIFWYCDECRTLTIDTGRAAADAKKEIGYVPAWSDVIRSLMVAVQEAGITPACILMLSSAECDACPPGPCVVNARHHIPHVLRRFFSWN